MMGRFYTFSTEWANKQTTKTHSSRHLTSSSSFYQSHRLQQSLDLPFMPLCSYATFRVLRLSHFSLCFTAPFLSVSMLCLSVHWLHTGAIGGESSCCSSPVPFFTLAIRICGVSCQRGCVTTCKSFFIFYWQKLSRKSTLNPLKHQIGAMFLIILILKISTLILLSSLSCLI